MKRIALSTMLALLLAVVAPCLAARSRFPVPPVSMMAVDTLKADTSETVVSTEPDSRVPTSGMEAARRFWRDLLEGRYDSLEGVVGFPFQWDSRCRIFAGISQIRDEAERGRDPEITIEWGDVREVAKGDSLLREPLFEPLVLPLSVLDCDEGESRDLMALAAHPQRYYTVLLRVDGEEILTAVRVTRLADGWRVTGLNN